jgi:hypothetical protein
MRDGPLVEEPNTDGGYQLCVGILGGGDWPWFWWCCPPGCCLNIVADLAPKRTKLPLNQSLKMRVSNRPLSVNKSVKQLTHTQLLWSSQGYAIEIVLLLHAKLRRFRNGFASIITIINQSAQSKDERRERAVVVGRRKCALCSGGSADAAKNTNRCKFLGRSA